ncbi:MAG: hypothetical protein ACJ8FZ_26030 [Bradyrhizobium sp.]
MMIRASGRSALILATGLFVCFAGPSPVAAAGAESTAATSNPDNATAGTSTKQSSRPSKRSAHPKSGKAASKSSEIKKTDDSDVADAAGGRPSAIPASVANANAQLTSDTPADKANAMSAKANTLLTAPDKPADSQPATDNQLVASDQLNEVDRALQQNPGQPATQMAAQAQTVAVAPVRAATAAPVLANSNESSTWDQTSLIGKIFIAFGALLTVASAARMFMA